ncbi:homoserine kinase [Uruburuella testudinis]|uniref:Homoserine kinase n=1 Tax=Uruburuella testudinis TaxID=1282863 RepID=A0ABY4DRA1_9NEIS|nr:homoserine kinase [Uruburuella testudinis]UOO81573.1 homoserine kinase [Uruburuella testudinis]
MSVYTSVSDDEMCRFLEQYNLGEFIALQGIAQGITNSNYFLTTTTGKFVLTVFEVLKQEELPFFLLLKQHLSENGVACPAPIPKKDGRLDATLAGKPACLVTCLKGADTGWPTEAQCFHTGAMLAKMHLAGQSFPLKMENPRYTHWWHKAYQQLLPVLEGHDAVLLADEINYLDQHKGDHLPRGIIHADLFKDNVLLDGEQVAGFIDFYYACEGNFMYDLAIAVNDWARTADNQLNDTLEAALLNGYQSIRPLNDAEQAYYPTALRAGCIRFWVSRLLDFHFPQEGEMTFIKDPNVFRDLLLSLKNPPQKEAAEAV